MSSWIPPSVAHEWHFSCNSKGWTSNIHGEQWLAKCFEPTTRLKANGRKRLLLCDGHDSHISAQFVRFCIDHDIVLFLLLPHSSHLLQPLDVGVFSPLKRAMSSHLSRLYSTEISRLHKVEWLKYYIKARTTAITSQNVLGGWRGAGLFPTNPHRVLRLMSDNPTPSTPSINQTRSTTLQLLVTSSPPDAMVLRSTNAAFNEALLNASLSTPIRKHGRRLSGVAEQLQAENTILRHENRELKELIHTRKERLSGKRVILKGHMVVSTEELYQKLAEAERATRGKMVKSRKNKRGTVVQEEEMEDEDIGDESEIEGREIGNCIEVLFP